MTLIEEIDDELKDAMRARDAERRDTLRLILNALKNSQKELQRPLSEEEELQVLQRERKRRLEAADAFRTGGREEQAAAEQARQAPTSSPVVTPPPPVNIPIGNPGGGHAAAASIALRYLGVPYVWGGSSPAGFDCSGLVMYVYAQLGISLPHYTVAQWNATLPISSPEPGDLVFFNGLGHVGIYIGGGKFVNAPHTGSVVRIDSMSGFGGYDGARRVG